MCATRSSHIYMLFSVRYDQLAANKSSCNIQCDDMKYYKQSILNLQEQESKEQSCAELPKKFKMTSKQEHVVSLCCLMWSKLMCQFTGITGIYLNAKQEQTHKDHEQKLGRALHFSLV